MTAATDDTTVLVGIGTAVHRPDDGPTPDPISLMTAAARAAGSDGAGDRGAELLAEVTWLGVAKGTWTHPDPGRALARDIGIGAAHTVLAEVGILQQTVLARAVEVVAQGAAAALVVGGEAAYTTDGGAAKAVAGSLLAESTGPDERWTTDDYGLSHEELSRGFVDPPTVYTVIESAALAHQAGRSPLEQRDHLGRLQARFSAVTPDNPDAWRRSEVNAATVATPTADNRLVAEPYTKLCCSNLRVNQAAALLLTTVGRARAAGVPEEQWVFPHTSTESNLSVPVLHRPDLHRSPGAAVAGRRALELADASVDSIEHLDLYSCFPAAVQVYAAELGVDLDRQPTVTGGMTFAGGPLNNYVFQSTAAMARVLREDPGSRGLVTSVSGMITKQGFAVWSTEPPPSGFRFEDVTEEVRRGDDRRSETGAHSGPVTIVGHTVLHDRNGPVEVLAVAETDEAVRLIVHSGDADLIEAFTTQDQVGTVHDVRDTELLT